MAHDTNSPAPIEVHCPNPVCSRVHRVKGVYGGARGRCPACSSWMYVPRPPAPPPKPATPPFGWAATLFLLLGMAGLAAAAASPLLPGHAVEATGDLARTLGAASARAVAPAQLPFAVGVPLALLALPLGALLTGAAYRRPTALGLLLTYAAVGLASALALVAVQHFHEQMGQKAMLEQSVAAVKAEGAQGDATFRPGPYLFAGLGGSAAAAAMFVLAAFALHRRFWSRVVGSLALGLPLALGSAWVYRKELGLDGVTGFWE